MRKIQFVSNQIYHVYNRGVEKRNIFLDDKDYFRFIYDLFEFNDQAPAGKFSTVGDRDSDSVAKPEKRKLLVEILAFCLMPNHFHLFLRQLVDDGISGFMRKLGVGYVMYFNKKNKRVGPLFQGRFKAVLIEEENHFQYLPYYIHLNPLDLKMPNWKEEGIGSYKEAKQFLDSYRWSSHLDYIGKKNFPSVVSKKFLNKTWGSSQEYKSSMKQWLRDFSMEEISKEIIE